MKHLKSFSLFEMANSNRVIRNSERKMIQSFFDVKLSEDEAEKLKSELISSGKYDRVRIKPFKIGPKPKKIGDRQSYNYAIYGYIKKRE